MHNWSSRIHHLPVNCLRLKSAVHLGMSQMQLCHTKLWLFCLIFSIIVTILKMYITVKRNSHTHTHTHTHTHKEVFVHESLLCNANLLANKFNCNLTKIFQNSIGIMVPSNWNMVTSYRSYTVFFFFKLQNY